MHLRVNSNNGGRTWNTNNGTNTASKAMMLQNAQLSNTLDKAVAQMGDAMALMDYSDIPAERAEVFVDANTNADKRLLIY